ncbi:S41 family peptidase [Streptomyces sp. CBMA152]|uniref:S41 family peptidase n=1 Tax=Streptomyces sp. CBMA152 TaxID=1896312 RepID=UPI001660D85C|nr:S41 family peptidase [Streptomyces sp. CBMA152]MBD0743037.1 peptidase S41 [Streptomyces sp. CBMA152]
MSGPDRCPRPRGVRRGATLTLVFVSVLATAAVTGSLPRADERGTPLHARPASAEAPASDRGEDVARAAAEAVADGKSPSAAAAEVVSRSGDRWGAVYDPSAYEQFEDALDGRYTGVGLWARRTGDGRVEVTRVQPGGPAARAGIEAGDRLRTIDGRAVDQRPVTEVVSLLRGDGAAAGSRVVLGLERAGRTWAESLRRALLTTEAVTVSELPGGDVMIKVAAFTKGSGERVRTAVREAPEGAGVLLDLRGNTGGLVNEAARAASAFLDGGLVATYDVHGRQRALYADPANGADTSKPLVVLVDGGTMSAAELLTGALQDRGRAVTVGSRTFGKGSVQMPTDLPDGSVAELTVGHYRTPAGHSVDGKGITPDVPVTERAQERAETVLSGLGGRS